MLANTVVIHSQHHLHSSLESRLYINDATFLISRRLKVKHLIGLHTLSRIIISLLFHFFRFLTRPPDLSLLYCPYTLCDLPILYIFMSNYLLSYNLIMLIPWYWNLTPNTAHSVNMRMTSLRSLRFVSFGYAINSKCICAIYILISKVDSL